MAEAGSLKDEVNISSLLDEQALGPFQLRTAILCTAVVFMDGFDAQAIGYVAPGLSRSLNLAPGALGPVFGAGLFGLMLGALIFSPLADRFGRKPVIVLCTLLFGICSLLTTMADSITSLLIWRFVTGLGLGGAMPNPIALVAEYSPRHRRATTVMLMFIGFSLGAALGGVISARLVPSYGWKSVFIVGGIVPIALVPVLVIWLPESARLLALRGRGPHRIAALLAKLAPTLRLSERTVFVVTEETAAGFEVRHLFDGGRGFSTILLWIVFFMNLLDLYFLANWLPTVINAAGLAVGHAIIISAMFQVGGVVGTLVFARLIDRLGPYRVLACAFVAAGAFIAAIGSAGSSEVLITATVLGAGFCVVGAQIGANALAATFYPTFMRSTGVGWALGIGRIGSIIGPVIGGVMLMLHWKIPIIFVAGAAPALLAALAVSTMGRLSASGADSG